MPAWLALSHILYMYSTCEIIKHLVKTCGNFSQSETNAHIQTQGVSSFVFLTETQKAVQRNTTPIITMYTCTSFFTSVRFTSTHKPFASKKLTLLTPQDLKRSAGLQETLPDIHMSFCLHTFHTGSFPSRDLDPTQQATPLTFFTKALLRSPSFFLNMFMRIELMCEVAQRDRPNAAFIPASFEASPVWFRCLFCTMLNCSFFFIPLPSVL